MIRKSRSLQKIALMAFWSLFFLISNLLLPTSSYAQFLGYTSPQTVQQTLANGVACTGSLQNFNVQNLGQVVHQFTIIPSVTNTTMQAAVVGTDGLANAFQISDTVYPTNAAGASILTATGYYPLISLQITCTAGTFTVTYAGASSFSFLNNGTQMKTSLVKSLAAGLSAGSSTGTTLLTPYGSTAGVLSFNFVGGAGPAGSTVSAQCSGQVGQTGPNVVFALATPIGAQSFSMPAYACPQVVVTYTSGGASANTYNLEYVFWPQGSQPTVSGSVLSAGINDAPLLSEKGARWDVFSSPAVSLQATASKAAGTAGVRHVADCVTASAGASTAPAATNLVITLRDGASGAGTVIWTTDITAAATAANHGNVTLCGLNLIGTAATAMTLEFTALLTNEFESVTLTGYDVQ
jgi:hypothetical protein